MGFSSKAEVYKAIIDLDDRVYQMNIEKHNDIENYISAMMAMQQNKSNIISALIMMRAYYAYGQVLEEIEDERSRFKLESVWRKDTRALADWLDENKNGTSRELGVYDKNVFEVERLMYNVFSSISEYLRKELG